MHGDIGETDRRAILLGAVVGVVATVAIATLDDQWVRAVILGSPVVGLLAGGVAAHTSRERMQPFREGAFAAAVALPVGTACWMAVAATTTSTYALDVFLLLSPVGYVVFAFAFPITFVVGGVSGHVTLAYGS